LNLQDPKKRIFIALEVGIKSSSADLPTLPPRALNGNPIIHSTYYTPSRHRSKLGLRNINRISIGSGVRHPLRTD